MGGWGEIVLRCTTESVTTYRMSEGDKSINVRVREAEKELFEAAARRDRRKLSDWVRIALIDAARQLLPEADVSEVEKRVLR